jgi:hypothetical protein
MMMDSVAWQDIEEEGWQKVVVVEEEGKKGHEVVSTTPSLLHRIAR